MNKTEGVYYIIMRCVRRAFLCGDDKFSGQNYDHRKFWIKERLQELSGIFGLDVCGYSVMSNHLHIVLRTRPDIWKSWSNEEVAARWWQLFPKRREKSGEPSQPKEQDLSLIMANKKRLKELRNRLGEISWFMRCLNEFIAHKGNKEDDCTGRFWEGRFKCQALLDDAAILTCMAYVDLNPVRAKIAKTPEKSEFTSVKDRIDAMQAKKKIKALNQKRKAIEDAGKALTNRQINEIKRENKKRNADSWLNPIGMKRSKSKARVTPIGSHTKGILSLSLDEYLQLLDWTGRCIRSGKRGAIPKHLLPILERLDIDVANWVDTVISFGSMFYRVAGKVENIMARAKKAGQNLFHGLTASRLAFGSSLPPTSK